MTFYGLVSQGIIQTILLMLFKGAADHSLYRYTWLWLAALTVLCKRLLQDGGARICRQVGRPWWWPAGPWAGSART